MIMPTPWKKMMNKEFLGSWDLTEGQDLALTIDKVYQAEVQNNKGGKDKCLIVSFRETGFKPLILNNINASSIEKATGSKYVEDWPGKQISLFTATVSAFGTTTDAIRIRTSAPHPVTRFFCEECHKEIASSGTMSAETVAEYTKKKYGKSLCADCAIKEKKEEEK